MADISSLIAQFQSAEARARAANIAREQELRGMYGKIEERYAPGGAFQKGALAEIETAKTRGVGQEMQQLISSGMYGTTTAAGVPSRWESEVGTPARLRLEDISMERLTQAEQAKAGFIERIQEPYPDYGPLMQAMQAASSVGGGVAGGAYTGGAYAGRTPYRSTAEIARARSAGGYGQAAPTFRQGTQYTEEGIRYAGLGPSVLGDRPTAQPIGGKQLTQAQQFTVQERLKAMYPQMYQPGWGQTAPAAKPKASLWSRISSAALGRPF